MPGYLANLLLTDAIARRIAAAFSTIPDARSWLYSAALLGTYAAIALSVGFYRGFVSVEVQASRRIAAGVAIASLFFPGITEELFFRVLLLPHPAENAAPLVLSLSFWGSLVLFVAYHPLNAFTFFPRGRKIFVNPVFLFSAALLGAVCAIAYLQTGSIWPSVAIHWAVVAAWLLLFGGYGKLYASR